MGVSLGGRRPAASETAEVSSTVRPRIDAALPGGLADELAGAVAVEGAPGDVDREHDADERRIALDGDGDLGDGGGEGGVVGGGLGGMRVDEHGLEGGAQGRHGLAGEAGDHAAEGVEVGVGGRGLGLHLADHGGRRGAQREPVVDHAGVDEERGGGGRSVEGAGVVGTSGGILARGFGEDRAADDAILGVAGHQAHVDEVALVTQVDPTVGGRHAAEERVVDVVGLDHGGLGRGRRR